MKIRNKNTGAEYSSATLMKQGMSFADPVDVKLPFFTFAEGWEEVKEPQNEIVINGVHHIMVEDKKMEGDCRDCSLQQLCDELRGDGICIKMFDRLDSHFEVKEE